MSDDDPHRWAGRVDVGVPHHELFQDVVLDGAGESFGDTPCSSPATIKSAITGSTAPFIVIETDIL